MRTRAFARALLAALLLGGSAALACGFCIEDRVAAVYDQGMVEGALARHQHVAFFALEGSLAANEATRRSVTAALDAAGGVRGTARVSVESASCAVAFDPARTSLAALGKAAERGLKAKGIALSPLRIIDAEGRLREP